ncbi:MAG: two-component regulator propeller domain-containing protein [Bacteroidales bacterium]
MKFLKAKHIFLVLIICLLTSVSLHAQYAGGIQTEFTHYNYSKFINISANNGLSSNLVLNILQDKYGFMWFATDCGLSKYDGTHFKNFKNNVSDSSSISHNFVTSLTEDCYGNLWVGTKSGLNLLIRERDCFKRVIISSKYSHVRALYADKLGYLWIEYAGNNLVRYNIKTKKWKSILHSTGYPEGEHYYFHLFEDSKETIWIGGRSIMPVNITDKKNMQTNLKQHSSLVGYEASCYVEKDDGTILCSDHNGVLSKYNRHKNTFETIMQIPTSPTCSTIDKQGNIWIGGRLGLVKIGYEKNKAHEKIYYINNNEDSKTSLVSNDIYCIYADKEDNIWIGTNKGISLYSNFQNSIKHYHKLNNTKNTLSSNEITSLMQDTDGLLWIGTFENGVDTLNLSSEKFGNLKYSLLSGHLDAATLKRERYTLQQYKLHRFIRKQVNENKVTTLYQDSKGKIYIGLYSHVGFNVYDKKLKTLNRYALWSEKPTLLYPMLFEGNLFGSNWYADFLEDSYGRFWCATWEGVGLNLFNREKGEFLGKNYIHGTIPRPHTSTMYSSYKDSILNRIYIGGGKYYGYYDITEKKFHRYAEIIPKQHVNKEILDRYYNNSNATLIQLPMGLTDVHIANGGNGNIYILSDPYILKHNTKNNSIKIIKKPLKYTSKPSVCGNYIYINSSYFDIYRISLKTDKVEALSNTCTNFNKIAEKITTVHPLPNGDLWIGTTIGLFYYTHLNKTVQEANIQGCNLKKEISYITGDNNLIYIGSSTGLSIIKGNKSIAELLIGEQIPYILIDNGFIYVCTNNGLFKIKDNRIVAHYYNNPLNPNSLSSNSTAYICRIDDSTLFVTNHQGIEILNEHTKCFYSILDNDEYTISSRLASCVIEDSNGNIWYGTTSNGINIINMKTDKVHKYGCYTWDKNSLPNNNITCIKEDKAKNIWIGTANGLYLILKKDITDFSKFKKGSIGKRISKFLGIHISRIEEDKKGNMWISTNNGLFCYKHTANSLKKFNQYLGFQSNKYSSASAVLQNGYLAFGGEEGFNIFHPDSLLNTIKNPAILVTDFRCGNTTLYSDMSNIKSPIKLSYSQNNISFVFSAPNYGINKFIQYRYRLKGYDTKWNNIKHKNSIPQYNNIPHGKYLLEIEATNCVEEWYCGYSISINIAPPFYLSWWFFILGILFICGLVYIVAKNRKLIKEKLLLRQILEQKNKELKIEVENKNKFFSILAHDLKNPISDLNFISQTLYNNYNNMDKDERLKYIEILKSSSNNTSELLNSILLWALSQRGTINPNFKEVELYPLLKDIIETAKISSEKKHIEIINNVSNNLMVYTDYNLLSTIIRNLLSNAIKFSPVGEKITIEPNTNQQNKLLLSITNCGPGISAETIKKIFKINSKISSVGTLGEKGSGLGLIIVNELLCKLNEKIYVDSQPNNYTTFTITISYEKNY